MSTRAIGSALGVDPKTVRNDLAQLGKNSPVPDRVTGTDGKERPAVRPAPKRAEPPAAPEPDITPDVLRVLSEAGAAGALAFRVAFLINNTKPDEPHALVVLNRLADAGKVQIVDATEGGALWALTELVERPAPETPEPDAAPSTAPAGAGSTSPDPEPDSESVEPRAALLRRAARTDLRRVIDLLVPADRAPGFVEDWIKQLGPRDDELAELIRRAEGAIAVLDDLIERAGQ
jgi:hypothetical protein